MNPVLMLIFLHRPKKDDLEKQVLKHVMKSSRRLESASIKQEAYIMGMSDQNNIDLEKYVKKIEEHIADEEANTDEGKTSAI